MAKKADKKKKDEKKGDGTIPDGICVAGHPRSARDCADHGRIVQNRNHRLLARRVRIQQLNE